MSDDACLALCSELEEGDDYSLAGRDFCQRMEELLLKQLRTLEKLRASLEELSKLYNGQSVSLNIQSIDKMIQHFRETLEKCQAILNNELETEE